MQGGGSAHVSANSSQLTLIEPEFLRDRARHDRAQSLQAQTARRILGFSPNDLRELQRKRR